jgi:hypothetical protein
MATGYAGGGVFNGNANREVITVPFLSYGKKRGKNLWPAETDFAP